MLTIINTISAVPSFKEVISVFKEAKGSLGEILSSCEFMDSASMECVTGREVNRLTGTQVDR